MPVLAASTQQKLGFAVAILLAVGWAFYIAGQLWRRRRDEPPGSELELAPNRKAYFDDDLLESKKLDRSLLTALFLLIVVALGLPLYWSREPARGKNHARGFEERSAYRGFLMFQPADSPLPSHNIGHFGCAGCHGSVGQGGVTSYVITDALGNTRKVQWKAPALNTVLRRYTADTVRTILIYGRANTPMPAWGVSGGGPMNEQQILDLVEYLKSIQLKPDKAREVMQADLAAEAKRLGKSSVDGQVIFNVNCA